ncbi:hypothetical protein [Streptomyces sp. ISL-11]|uniref:hypothetical protein n=1 Tax=Streptomyces sp. ISL-11 TaxID=2819174 RepID=UPI001BEA3F2C|nr:hypothetical protein [Streptomyces sp. ISL-11]MBT2382662.1 hypothetical protein [Streptomyces sp. ISL-11]
MTYRNGAYVVDTREDRIGQVIGGVGKRVHVRMPGGGQTWEVPFEELRLATREERAAAGLWPVGERPSLRDCKTCPELDAAWREAKAGGDEVEAGNALVAQRRHWRSHVLPGGPA